MNQLEKPVRFVCDKGPELDNDMVLTYCRDIGVAIVFPRSYTNTVDRAIQTLKSMLFPRLQRLGQPWHQYLNRVVDEDNQTVHSTTGMKPNEAHEGKKQPAGVSACQE